MESNWLARQRRSWVPDGYVRLVAALFIAPVPFEIVIAYTRGEAYDFRRAAVVVGTMMVLALILLLFRAIPSRASKPPSNPPESG
jgi:hypothetical protein